MADRKAFADRPRKSLLQGLPCTFGKSPAFPAPAAPVLCFFPVVICNVYSARTTTLPWGSTGAPYPWNICRTYFLKLEEKGAANINLVTGTHFIPQIAAALELSRRHGLSIPIVYNTGSYEKVSSLRLLEGLVDIYLPDLKYKSSALSAKYSHAEDYFPVAAAAITEMFRQVGTARFDSTGMMRSGIIVCYLLLPGQAADSKRILRYLHNTYGSNIYISIMNQYTPLPHVADIPELNRKISPVEYAKNPFLCGTDWH